MASWSKLLDFHEKKMDKPKWLFHREKDTDKPK